MYLGVTKNKVAQGGQVMEAYIPSQAKQRNRGFGLLGRGGKLQDGDGEEMYVWKIRLVLHEVKIFSGR